MPEGDPELPDDGLPDEQPDDDDDDDEKEQEQEQEQEEDLLWPEESFP